MGYSTDEDLLMEFSDEELARLTGDSNGEEINFERIAHVRNLGDALIDSYLRGQYPVPLDVPADKIIQKCSLDLVIAGLYEISYKNATVPSTVTWRKINAVKLLKDIQKGLIVLSKPAAEGASVLTNRDEADRLFDDELMDQFFEM
jgi:phage gp36-like protein